MPVDGVSVTRRRRFTAAVMWPTIAALPVFVALLGLGTWQVQRLHWKEALIAERAARAAAPPIGVEQAGDPAGQEFRRVRAVGTFRHDREMFLESRVQNGEAGYHVVTPLALRSGGAVLVDRGWVRTRASERTGGEVAVEGFMRRGGKSSSWTPDNDPARNTWYYVDIPAMAAAAGMTDAKPFFIDTGEPPELPNNHLQYAITWYGLAAVLVVIYGVFVSRRLRREP